MVADIALIGDINIGGESAESDPQELTQAGDTLFFTAMDKTHGRELWKQEGTNAAVLVKDIFPGSESSRINHLTAVGNTLFFIADDGANGNELWKSDGTAAGTVMVVNYVKNPADIDPQAPAHPGYGIGGDNLTNVNGKLFFRSGEIDRGPQGWVSPFLMVSDGTEAGTQIVTTDISLPLPWNYGASITAVGNEAWFFGSGLGNEGSELWKSDGTAVGTVLVSDVWSGPGSSLVRDITPVGSTVYFAAMRSEAGANNDFELWKSDGTHGGTMLVKDINSGTGSSDPRNLFNFNGTLMFVATDGAGGRELWKSNGTAAGTVQVKDILSGPSGSNPGNMTPVGNTLFFSANDGINGEELWRTNGTSAGTVMVGHGGTSSNFNPSSMVNIGGSLYFRAFTFESGYEIFRSDGTTAGTNVFKDLRPGTSGSSPTQLINVNGVLHYAANDGGTGNELWQHNVTTNAATVSDIFRGTLDSSARDFTNVNGTIFFVANDGTHGEELWKISPSGTETSLVKDIFTGSAGSQITELVEVNGTLYFTALDETHGKELWKSDGTSAGTVMVRDIATAAGAWSEPRGLVNFNDTLLFSALSDGSSDRELWRSDGTQAGTVLVKDIQPGAAAGVDRFFPQIVSTGTVAYFSANDGSNGFELWKTDGTTAGTVLVKDIRTATSSSDPRDLFNFNGTLYFTAWDGVNGRELWKSNGTAAGTTMAADLTPGSTGSSFQNFTNAGGKLIFQSYNSGSNGVFTLHSIASPGSSIVTVNQTQNTGHARVFDQPLTAVGGTVFFAHQDNDMGLELWKSDGTSAGTVPVKDINTRTLRIGNLGYTPSGSNPVNLLNNNGTLYFTANNGFSGQELWKSDGTSAGTRLVADLTGESGSSHPEKLTVVNNRIYMTAITESTGREIFAVLDQPQGTNGDDVFVLTYNGNGGSATVSVTVTSDNGPEKSLGSFPMSLPLRIDGLLGTDTVEVRGTSANDLYIVDSLGIRTNGALLSLTSVESRILAGRTGNDTYRFNTNGWRGSFVLDESGGGVDTIDFSTTTTRNINFSLNQASTQIVNTNLAISLLSTGSFENVIGGSGDDRLTGNSLANVLTGGPGNDSLIGGLGDDTYLFATAMSAEADTLTEGVNAGADTISFATITTPVTFSLATGAVQSVHANRTIRLNSTVQFENVAGGSASDRLTGNAAANMLTGNAGDDILNGAAGNDSLFGGTGDDTYLFATAMSAEADTLTEGVNAGADTISFATITTPVTFSLATGAVQSVHANRTIRLNSTVQFENVAGGSASDRLTGNAAANMLTGNAGDDILNGAAGNDSLIGGLGDDTYLFATAMSAEADTLTEGVNAGADTISFATITTPVTFSLATGAVQSVHANRTIRLNSTVQFENVAGGSASDRLTGNAAANVLIGNAGNDILRGSGNRDILIGGFGLDSLNGGDDDDILIGGRTTSDVLFGNLNKIRAEWISANSYTNRVSNLRTGAGTSGVSLKAKINVLNDAGDDDLLAGENGIDWYFRALDDAVTGLLSGELTDVL